MDAWGLTDHGTAAGHAHAHKHFEKLQKKGVKYRQLYGIEFYFVPSLNQWSLDYEAHREAVKAAKEAKKSTKAETAEPDEKEQGHIIENAEDTRSVNEDRPEWKRRYHLVVLAKNQTGLNNLYRLATKSNKHGYYRYPRIDFDWLKEHGDGLIVSTACIGGILSQRILRGEAAEKSMDEIQAELSELTDQFIDAVGSDNFFLELQFNKYDVQHVINKHLFEHSRRTGIQLVVGADSHYPRPELWEARELYRGLGWGSKDGKLEIPKYEELKGEYYPKNAAQMWEWVKWAADNHPEVYAGNLETVCDAIERTYSIAWEQCEDTWIDTSVKLPDFATPDKTAFQQLVERVRAGMIELDLADKPEYIERIKEEMADIKYLGFENYFLVMHDVFHRASNHTLFGSGRGSASGGLINYVLGITQLDPIKYGLLWSRFLGRHRVSWPDIDSDAGNRDALINAARELYGEDAVIPVSNFNTLKLLSLVKDCSKYYEVDFQEVNNLTKVLQREVEPLDRDPNEEKSVYVLTHAACMKHSPKYKKFMEKYPKVKTHIETLFMQNRSVGRHAGGVIIAPAEQLAETMPIIKVRGDLQTPWTEGMNFRNLEDNGFIKFDFLGLTLMKDVENCIRRILRKDLSREPEFSEIHDYFDANLNCRFNEPDDPKVFETAFHQEFFAPGMFQFTQKGARQFCNAVKPYDVEELGAVTAIYRPGPLKANVHKKYVKTKQAVLNGDKIRYPHPLVEETLSETLGYQVFQEHWMILAQKLSGFSPGESDKLRKTLVKKSLDTLDAKAQERVIAKKKFVEGGQELHDIPRHEMEELWEQMRFFSLYGFNKAHAVAYAIDSYYAAWLYTYHPHEWLATVLQSENGNAKGQAKTIAEIKMLGYKILQPDVNLAGMEWVYSEKGGGFVPPLSAIKGVGVTSAREIIKHRPYRSLKDLLYVGGEWYHSKMNKTSFSSLCKVEAFGSLRELQDGTINHHRQLHAMLIDNYDKLRKGRKGMSKTQVKRFEKKNHRAPPDILDVLREATVDLEDWDRRSKIEFNYDLQKTAPLDLLFPDGLVEKLVRLNIPSAIELGDAKGVAWFFVTECTVKKTKTGKDFLSIRISDHNNETGTLRIWGASKPLTPYSIWMGQIKGDKSWGPSTGLYKIKQIDTLIGG